MIPNEFIQNLLSRVDVVDVVGRQVQLKKTGQNLVGLCPFHKEKSPSFSVSPSKQFYHCFGCGAGGDAISFIMEMSGRGYVEAIEELARGLGMTVPQDPQARAIAVAQNSLSDELLRAADFYKEQLKQSKIAIDYFKSRGVSGEIARHFGLGYAPEGWQNLASCFENYEAGSLVECGLVIQREDESRDSDQNAMPEAPHETPKRNRRYDRFRHRVMFPIQDRRGRLIGFGGRVLDGSEPKYLNSPETPIFSKGRELYGLFQALRSIRSSNRALVVEGYMDVIALHQHEVEIAVATLGTATSVEHINTLFRLADAIVFAFDGDNAGRKAAWRALENSLPALQDGKQVKFLFLPDEHDPDSFIRTEGKEAFEAALEGALPLSRYWLEELARRHPEDTPEDKAALAAEGQTYLAQISAPNLQDALLTQLAARTGVSVTTLRGNLGRRAGQGARQSDAPRREDWVPGMSGPDIDRGAVERDRFAGSRYNDRATAQRTPRRLPRVAPPSIAMRLLRLLVVQPKLALNTDPDRLPANDAEQILLRQLIDVLTHAIDLPANPAAVLRLIEETSPIAESLRAWAQDEMLADTTVDPVAEWEGLIRLLTAPRSTLGRIAAPGTATQN